MAVDDRGVRARSGRTFRGSIEAPGYHKVFLGACLKPKLVRAGGGGIPSRGPTRLLGSDVGPLSIWTTLNKGYALSKWNGGAWTSRHVPLK